MSLPPHLPKPPHLPHPYKKFLYLDDHDAMPHPYWYDEQINPLIDKIGRKAYIDFVEQCVIAVENEYNRYQQLNPKRKNTYTYYSFSKSVDIAHLQEEFEKELVLDEHTSKAKNSQFYFTYTLEGRIFRGIFHSIALVYNDNLIEFVKEFAVTNVHDYKDSLHLLSLLPIKISLPIIKSVKAILRTKTELKFYNQILFEISNRTKVPLDAIKKLA